MSESSADEPLAHGRHTDPAGRDVPAEDSPVPAGPATVPMGARPSLGPNRLVLRAPSWFSVVGLAALAAFLIGPIVAATAQLLAGAPPMALAIPLAFFVVPASLIGAWLYYRLAILPRVTFDQEAGLLTLGWKGLRGRRPLSSVIGVQVMQTRKQFGGPELNVPAVTMYQLNLILDDPAERRLNVMTCDSLTARSNARLVADFLGVPVLDSAGTPAGAAAETTATEYWGVPSPVVTQPGPDVLLIRPRRLAFMSGFHGKALAVVALLALAALLVLAAWGAGAAWFIVTAVVGAALGFPLLMTFIIMRRRARFDRAQGVLTLEWLNRRALRKLASVKAVEVVDGPDSRLKLLLDDPRQTRLILIADADAALVRRAAERVASFLGVPLLDASGTPAAAAATAASAAELRPLELWWVQSPEVAASGPDVLLIRPRRLARLSGFRGMSLLAVVLLGVLAAQGAAVDWSLVVLAGALLLVPLMGLLTQGRQARFDRARGVLTLGWRGRRVQPLASVQAVEVVDGPVYQLNVLPNDPRQPRLNLIWSADAADAALVRRAAERVASFLGVPLLGASRQTPAAAQSGGGATVNPLEELDRSPLPPGSASVRGPARVVPKGDDGLVLRPRSRFTWFWLAPALLTMGLDLYVVWLVWQGPPAGWAGLRQSAGLLAIVLFGALSQFSAFLKPLLLYRDHFDRQAGLLTLGWFGLKGTHPLAKVLAVQLVPGGLVAKAAGAFGRGGERVSYQLNLVMADLDQDRLNLANDTDLAWTRQAGRQVADFLGVPVIDQIADGD